ncbi:hypothetical protein CLV78_101391 [Aliiruegeria haliotis]|uniref:Uncharacterized protein n=1 Tax=Aliiruegeria haliotis TaxID=1280846 RepID=A0A2T0RYM8_9RHOB|nr:hypothetical protein [Aliiruegeria haliotis]PRY26296.1 hypothetical protein CLV78_101391 [Aliiruegeria haliotis]
MPKWLGAICALVLAGCAAPDPGLEQSLAIETGRRAPAVSAGRTVAGTPGPVAPQSLNPDWDPRDRVPNTNPRIVTNNAYGPGRSSDVYGRVVHHNPGLKIEEKVFGSGRFEDQYGRPVRCASTGMGTFCR